MHTWTGRMTLGLLIVASLALGALAQVVPKENLMNEPSLTQWTLSTDDTFLKVSVANNRIFIETLKNPTQNWNWTPVASEVPLIKNVVIKGANQSPNWIYQNAVVDRTTGTTVTLLFSSTAPKLELKSIWRTRPGVGPVEHRMEIVNRTEGNIEFKGDALVAANLNMAADKAAHFFPVAQGKIGYGENQPLPYQMIQVAKTHGVFLAYDFGCGQFTSTATENQITSRWWAADIVNTTTAVGETFRCPGMIIQTYQGDEDDGANGFKRWFWRYEITRSLYDNPNDPPIEMCEDPGWDAKPDLLIDLINTKNLASWGVQMFKTDGWHCNTGHAKSAELAAACRANGLQLCMYWDGPRSEAELVAEWNKSKYDYYRMDQWGKPPPFNPRDYHSFMDFNQKVDSLSKKYGIKLENCCNGGNLRSLDLFRRMTFMTPSDAPVDAIHIYNWSYLICPIQIKHEFATDGKTPVADWRRRLMGSILVGFPHSWDQTAIDRFKTITTLYNTKQRAILRGADVYHILPSPEVKKAWWGIQYNNTFINKGSVLLWQNGGPASQIIKLKGLERNVTYQLTFEDATEKNRSLTGAQLMDDGVDVPMGPNASEIIWFEKLMGKPETKPSK